MLNNFFSIVHRGYRIIGRTVIKYSLNPRPASYPYITGDGFRNFADHIYDNTSTPFNPSLVMDNDIVFVGDSNIKNFLKKVHPNIKHSYVLITHNGDEEIDEEAVSLIDENILRWYGINVTASHPKVTPLPLGIGNKHYYVTGIPSIFRNIAKKDYPKMNRIFYGFTTMNNPQEREPALAVMKRNKCADTLVKWVNFPNYMKLLATYKFVVSPPGSSVEGHRTWEALYVGVVPVVKSSVTIDYFEKIGLPIWAVKDWNELDNLREDDLENKFENIKKNSNYGPLYMNYWIDKIRNMKG